MSTPSADGGTFQPRLKVDALVCGSWLATGDAADTVIDDGAVAIDGREIVDVGPTGVLRDRYEPRSFYDLAGHLLLPGFINAHTHLAMTMFRGMADDLDLQDFLGRVMPTEAAVLDADRVFTATRAGLAESLLAGVTTSLDMYFFPDEARRAAAEVGARIVTGPVLLDPVSGPLSDGYDPPARLRWAEATVASGDAGVVSAHAAYTTSPAMIEAGFGLAERAGLPFHVHASENAAEVEQVAAAFGRRPVEHLADLGVLAPNTVLAHCVDLTPAEIDVIATSGASVAHCPYSNLKLASGVAPTSDLRRAGVRVVVGTDGPASSNDLDVRSAGRLAALLAKERSGHAAQWPASELLASCTSVAADALGLSRQGRLRAGNFADIVAMDLEGLHTQPVFDPLVTLFHSARASDVANVWVDGRLVVLHGALTSVDSAQVVDDLKRLGRVVGAAALRAMRA